MVAGGGVAKHLRQLGLAFSVLIASCADASVGWAAAAPRPTMRWSDAFGIPGFDGNPSCAVRFEGEWVVAGSFKYADGVKTVGVARWDGRNWRSMGDGLSGTVSALAVWRGRLIAGGSSLASGAAPIGAMAEWDGSLWQPFGPSVAGSVQAILPRESDLVIGGAFDRIGSSTSRNIALWDGSGWRPLGTGMDGPVHALANYRGEIVAGGSFQHAGTTRAANIARWDGSRWDSLDRGIAAGQQSPPMVFALATFGDQLFAGGQFDSAGTAATSGLATWNGASWAALPGAPEMMQAQSFASDGIVLRIGYWSRPVDGIPNHYLATWDGVTFRPDVSGPDNSPTEIVTGDGDVLVVGPFQTIDGRPMPGCAVESGGKWRRLSSDRPSAKGFYGVVTDLASFDGQIIAVGGPGSAGTDTGWVAVYGAAAWDGQGWRQMGELEPSSAGDLLVAGGNLFVANGLVRRWNGEVWEPLGNLLPATIEHLAFDGHHVWGGGKGWGEKEEGSGLWRLDKAHWTPIPPPAGIPRDSAFVTALAMHAGKLHVAWAWGGRDSWNPRTRIASWDGRAWSRVPGEFRDGRVLGLASFSGRLVAAGSFKRVSGRPISGFCVLEPGGWNAHGWSGQVDAIEPIGSALVVANRGISFFDGKSWTQQGQCSGQVTAIHSDGSALWLGGYFDEAGGKPASHVTFVEGLVPPSRVAPIASVPSVLPEGGRPLAAFTSSLIWDTDSGKMIERLGLRQMAIYLYREGSSGWPTVPVRQSGPGAAATPFSGDWGFSDAALNPSGDVIAFCGMSGDNLHRYRVAVATLKGREVVSFPGAMRPRWSPDGKQLAFLYAHLDAEWHLVPESLGVWGRENGKLRTLPFGPNDFSWGKTDSLDLEYSDRVERLDLASQRSVRLPHRYLDVSPDGRYSIGRDDSRDWRHRLIDDGTGADVFGCVLMALQKTDGNWEYLPEPFWIRTDQPSHLLCMSRSGDQTSPSGQSGWETMVVDPWKLDVLWRTPGKLVSPTLDHRGAIVLRGDSLALAEFGPLSPRRPANAMRVRIRMDVESWGSGLNGTSRRAVGTWVYDVEEGDWFADHADSRSSCFYRVVRIPSQDRVLIEFPPVFRGRQTNLDLGPSPVKLETDSYDGGYVVTLQVAP